jgi:hypothetical protein
MLAAWKYGMLLFARLFTPHMPVYAMIVIPLPGSTAVWSIPVAAA